MSFLSAFAFSYFITAVHYILRDKRRIESNQPNYLRKGLRGYLMTAFVWLPFMIPVLCQDWKFIRSKVVWKYKLEAFTSLSILIVSTALLMNWHR